MFKFLFKRKNAPMAFYDVYKEYVNKYVTENQLLDQTTQRYESYRRNLHLFLSHKKLMELPISLVQVYHMEEYRSWLFLNLRTCTKRHASRQIELCQRVMKYAVTMGYVLQNPIEAIKPQRNPKKNIVFLETNEIKKLMVWNFKNDIYRTCADLFLFQCFTGLSYSDIWRYQAVERNGNLWLCGERQKTGEANDIFFFREAKEIIIKYNGELPRIANQTYNRILKEIAEQLNIKKHLTTHVGRKTHATLLAERGVGLKPISMQLGNTIRVCDEDYVGNTYKIIEKELERNGLKESLIFT